MKYDLLIRDGEVIDPGAGLTGRLDVGLAGRKIVDPPKPRLPPGAVAHFKTPFEHPDDTATGVVVTFATR